MPAVTARYKDGSSVQQLARKFVFQKASEEVPFSYPEPPEYVAQGDRVLVIGFAKGKITATKAFEDHFVFDITVRDGKLAHIREFIDTQALARAAQMDASGLA